MAEIKVIECDGPSCDEERRGAAAPRWYEVNQRGVTTTSVPSQGLTFCQPACLAEWAEQEDKKDG